MAQIVAPAGQVPAIRTSYVVLVSFIASLGGFLFGYDINVMIGGLIFVLRHFQLTPMQQGFAVGSASIGCGTGAIIAGYIADRLGRKKGLAITAVVFAAGSIGTAIPLTILQFDIFRIVGGIGVGLASVIAPMYIAEMSPTHIRGRLVTLDQLAILTGAVVSITVCYYLSGTGNWRMMFATEAGPAFLLLAGLPLITESPRWLLEMNQTGRAREVLAKIYCDPGEIEREVREISNSLQEETGTFRELLHPGIRRALGIAVALAVLVQFTGICPLDYYLPVIFRRAGFANASDALLQVAFVTAWMWICTILAIFLVDRIGRRRLLIGGVTGIVIGMALLGLLFSRQIMGESVVIVTMFCLGCFVGSIAPMFWLLASELFPNRLRGKGMGIASLSQWVAAYLVTQAIPSMLAYSEVRYSSIGPVFWLFGVICVGIIAFTYYQVPETMDRSLEEIGASWTHSQT